MSDNGTSRVYIATFRDFFKLRLSVLVVISAFLGYLFADNREDTILYDLLFLGIGGFLVTGASNGINQILERDLDAMMKRTNRRPLPLGSLSVKRAWIIAVFSGVSGIALLYFLLNPLSALLAFTALVSYAFIYTPLKQVTPFAVFVGAFPGAVPPLLGWVAATGEFSMEGGILFAIQFIWQFPHFWSIAWVLDEDYGQGGFRLLPSKGGRDRSSAYQILIYTLFTIPVSLLPWAFDLTGQLSLYISVLAGAVFSYFAFKLYFSSSVKDARKLMFTSFIYLPVLQIVYVLDKI